MDNLPHLIVIAFTFIKPPLLSPLPLFIFLPLTPLFLHSLSSFFSALVVFILKAWLHPSSLCPTYCRFPVVLYLPSGLSCSASFLQPAGVNGKIMVTASHKSTQLENITIRVSLSFPPSSALFCALHLCSRRERGRER